MSKGKAEHKRLIKERWFDAGTRAFERVFPCVRAKDFPDIEKLVVGKFDSTVYRNTLKFLTTLKQFYLVRQNKAVQEKLSVAELRLQILTAFTPGNGIQSTKYNNNNPFPLRLGTLHQELQEEAFAMKTTIHERAITILRDYFQNKVKVIDM